MRGRRAKRVVEGGIGSLAESGCSGCSLAGQDDDESVTSPGSPGRHIICKCAFQTTSEKYKRTSQLLVIVVAYRTKPPRDCCCDTYCHQKKSHA